MDEIVAKVGGLECNGIANARDAGWVNILPHNGSSSAARVRYIPISNRRIAGTGVNGLRRGNYLTANRAVERNGIEIELNIGKGDSYVSGGTGCKP